MEQKVCRNPECGVVLKNNTYGDWCEDCWISRGMYSNTARSNTPRLPKETEEDKQDRRRKK